MNLRLGFAAALTLLTLLAIGCSDLGSPLAPAPNVSPNALDFGTLAVGTSSVRTVTISNFGSAPLAGEAKVSWVQYSIESGGGPFTLAPGKSRDVRVRFSPNSVGSFASVLSLGDAIPRVTLSGQASAQLPGSQCEVTPATLEFGAVTTGDNRSLTFTAKNPGTAPTTLDVVSDRATFVVISGGGPSSLAPGDSLVVSVSFRPVTAGPDSCLVATGPGCPPVRGRGIATAPPVSFAAHVLPILNARGCNSGCHSVFFTSTSVLVNVPSPGYAPARRIVPFNLVGSVLYGKVTNSGQYGESMPQGSPLIPLAERNKIRDWIQEGALNN